MKNIILASASPRRRKIMDKLNLPYRVVISNVKEVMREDLYLEKRIENLALQKAEAVFKDNQDCVVIGADTVVVLNGEVLGKPHNMTEAREMLKKLSGHTHEVITAYAVLTDEKKVLSYDTALVKFADISDEEIEKYIQTREPYDKAGGYAVQGWASVFIEKIDGSFYTVMGLPLHLIYKELKKVGYYD